MLFYLRKRKFSASSRVSYPEFSFLFMAGASESSCIPASALGTDAEAGLVIDPPCLSFLPAFLLYSLFITKLGEKNVTARNTALLTKTMKNQERGRWEGIISVE